MFERLRVHFGSHDDADRLFVHNRCLPEGAAAILGTRTDGGCVFLDVLAPERRCKLHRTLGETSLPSACRQFPRITLQDARGTFLTLSHYCPTAAGLLLQPAKLSVVPAPSGLALSGDVEGLDARTALPPLLRPDMLTDLEGYDTWERRAIGALARGDLAAHDAVSVIERATAEVEGWRPGCGPLRDAVHRAFDNCQVPHVVTDPSSDVSRFTTVLESVPAGLERPPIARVESSVSTEEAARLLDEYDRPTRAWLAARLFGNWVAYGAPRLRVVASALRAYLSVLRIEVVRQQQDYPELPPERHFVEAIRQADLLIVHLSDVRLLTERLARLDESWVL